MPYLRSSPERKSVSNAPKLAHRVPRRDLHRSLAIGPMLYHRLVPVMEKSAPSGQIACCKLSEFSEFHGQIEIMRRPYASHCPPTHFGGLSRATTLRRIGVSAEEQTR
jgi:hypothetical protein